MWISSGFQWNSPGTVEGYSRVKGVRRAHTEHPICEGVAVKTGERDGRKAVGCGERKNLPKTSCTGVSVCYIPRSVSLEVGG